MTSLFSCKCTGVGFARSLKQFRYNSALFCPQSKVRVLLTCRTPPPLSPFLLSPSPKATSPFLFVLPPPQAAMVTSVSCLITLEPGNLAGTPRPWSLLLALPHRPGPLQPLLGLLSSLSLCASLGRGAGGLGFGATFSFYSWLPCAGGVLSVQVLWKTWLCVEFIFPSHFSYLLGLTRVGSASLATSWLGSYSHLVLSGGPVHPGPWSGDKSSQLPPLVVLGTVRYWSGDEDTRCGAVRVLGSRAGVLQP